jgi:hypothetical protein
MIRVFAIQKDGSLYSVGAASGIGQDAGFNGIAAN